MSITLTHPRVTHPRPTPISANFFVCVQEIEGDKAGGRGNRSDDMRTTTNLVGFMSLFCVVVDEIWSLLNCLS